jgi:hypothetical protein
MLLNHDTTYSKLTHTCDLAKPKLSTWPGNLYEFCCCSLQPNCGAVINTPHKSDKKNSKALFVQSLSNYTIDT